MIYRLAELRASHRSLALALMMVASGALHAQSTTPDQETSQAIKAPNAVVRIGADLFGDKNNLYTGSLEFVQTDVSIPGNNALPVSIGRRIITGATKNTGRPFGAWDLDIPHLHGVFAKKDGWVNDVRGKNRCSNFSAPTAFEDFVPWDGQEFWQGNYIYVPGVGDQQMLLRDSANSKAPGVLSDYPVVTKEFWNFSCIASLKNDSTGGEGFRAIAPDGTTYRFDQMVAFPSLGLTKQKVTALTGETPGKGGAKPTPATDSPEFSKGTASLVRAEVWILPTEVTDRFGNLVRYTYDATRPANLTSITSSDGRAITVAYTHPSDPSIITSVSDGSRSWNYGYSSYSGSGQTYYTLDSVTLPDSSRWQLGGVYPLIFKMGVVSGTDGCDAQFFPSTTAVGSMVHPTGATATFTLKGMVHGRSDVPYTCLQTPSGGRYNPLARYFYTLSLVAKTISGPGVDALTWSYAYGAPNASWAPCESGCPTSKTVSVTDPDGAVTRHTYGNRYRISEGRVEQVDYGWNGTDALRTVKTRYRAPGAGPYPERAGIGGESITDGEALARFMPVDLVETSQQGATFTWTATSFDDMARVTDLTRASSLGMSRREHNVYSDNTPKWVLGQIAKTTEHDTGKAMVENEYHAATAALLSVRHFGHKDASMTYNADGTVATRLDGKNQATRLSNYKRGIPQSVAYPDGSSESAVVDNIGTVSSMTNAAGFTTTFKYDAMGRLAQITPPADSGIAWNPTVIEFAPIQSSEFGLPAGHWRQDVTTGKGVTSTYFDALWRPAYTMTYDAADLRSSAQVVKRTFDAAGRITFTSYPAAFEGRVDLGTRTEYDALGRPTAIRADSEIDQLVSTFNYGSPFIKTHTDARGYSTTTRFQAFDTPSEAAIASIAAPLGLNVAIVRDAFGKTLSINRSGDGASATRSYVYDQYERLCKTIEPETGGEIVDYDDAGNVVWRAPGLALTGAVCDRTSVAGAAKISFTYDAMNRLRNTSFGDGASSISRSYTPDGLPNQVSSGGATWTTTYNHRRLPVTQVLNFSGQNYTLTTGYDANAHVNQLRYPSENNPIGVQSIAYAPDALGRPSQVGSFATGIRYHPSGAIAGFAYGNGKVHTMTQNARALPERSTDAGVLQDRYAYDQNGNVTAIADELQNVSSRTMGYDALDRLATANAPGIWGAASYTYDVLDNIRTSTLGNRTSSYQYGARNLLDRLDSTSPGFSFAYVYDARGNVIQRGNQAFVFDLGNRLKSAPNRDTYVYDGFGRRVQTTAVDGTVTISVYSPAGQLLYTRRSGGPNPAASTEYIYLHQHQIAEVKR